MNKTKNELLQKYKESLPKKVINDSVNLKVIGNGGKLLMTSDGKKYHVDNKLNDLSGAEWTYFTNSVINTNFSTSGPDNYAFKIRKIHPSPKPPKLLIDIINFFTKENDVVFDFFAGVGGTLLSCSLTNRTGVGIELNPVYVDAYNRASNELGLEIQTMFNGDSNELINSDIIKNKFREKKAKLILIDPPYYNMMSKKKTGEDLKKHGSIATPFTNLAEDFGNMEATVFWDRLIILIEKSLIFLEKNGYVVIFIKDLQPKDKNANLLHAEMVYKVNSIVNLNYVGMKIWADQTAKLFPYGYPYSFVATQIHQYILIFKKTN